MTSSSTAAETVTVIALNGRMGFLRAAIFFSLIASTSALRLNRSVGLIVRLFQSRFVLAARALTVSSDGFPIRHSFKTF